MAVDFPHCTGWDFNPTADLTATNTSDTSGHKTRIVGPRDVTATVNGFSDGGASVVVEPGDSANLLTLYEDGVAKYAFNAVCESLTVECDIGGGGPVTRSWSFGGHYTTSGDEYAHTDNAGGPYSAKNGDATWGV